MTNQFSKTAMIVTSSMGPLMILALISSMSQNDSPTVKFALRMAVCTVVVAISWTFSRVVSKVLEDD